MTAQRTVVLQPSRSTAILGSLVLLAALLVGLVAVYKNYGISSAQGVGAGSGYAIAFALLIVLAIVVPILTYIALRRDGIMTLSPTEIMIGRRRVAWSDVSDITWDSWKGASWLVLRLKKGSPLKIQPMLYDGGAEQVLVLLRQYVPNLVSEPP
jgi:hypothetical protein